MDTIIKNAKIYVESGRFESAMLIRDGYIIAVGDIGEIEALAGQHKVIDAEGRTIVPGFIDSHMHLYNVGVSLRCVRLHGVSSIAECIELGRRFIEENKPAPGSVILGRGWNDDYFTDKHRMLNRHDLDRISEEYPIIYTRACGHALAANTAAIKLAGITADTPKVEGGEFELGDDGQPNGVFKENAMAYIQAILKTPDLDETKEILKTAMAHASSRGITSVQTNDMNEANYKLIWQAYQELADSGESTVRAYQQCLFSTPEGYARFISEGFKTGSGSDMNRVGPLKLLIDGSLGARTSLMRQDFNDMPGTRGILCVTPENLERFIEISVKNNMQVVIHAIGDRGIEIVLDAYQKMLPPHDNPLRWGVVHCQITDLPLLRRFAENHICALVQPIFLHYDMHIVADRVGEKLAATSYAFGTMDRLGIHNSYGSDAPVEDLDPMNNIYCAVTRRDLSGYPDGGWNPGECVSVEKAIDHYTIDGAFNSFEETKKGRLLPGYMADLVMLDNDIFSCDPMLIKEISPVMTMISGRIVYKA